MSMKVIKKDVKIALGKMVYTCDIGLGLYAEGKRPAIVLVDAASIPESLGEVVTTASTNLRPEFFTGMPDHYFAAKDYSENEGLWAQLEALTEGDGCSPLFIRTSKRLTTGHVMVSVYGLGPAIEPIFDELREAMTK